MNRYDLKDRTAIVTGGARGIGYEIAARLLESGSRVIIWDRDGPGVADAARRLSEKGTVEGVEVDLCDMNRVQKVTDAAASRYEKIEILVNNAGIAGPSMPLWEYPGDEWRRVVEVDLIAVFHTCRALVPVMRRHRYGRIVNVSSVAGKEGNPNMSAYSAAKAGVIGLTKSLGKELATDGVLVNCITPATADTEILKQFSREQVELNVSKVPMKRLVAVDEIANMVAWLCSEHCSFSTGAVFDISGGRCTY
jgi:3-oxoacyl-[acyl-carrier protein] reductase